MTDRWKGGDPDPLQPRELNRTSRQQGQRAPGEENRCWSPVPAASASRRKLKESFPISGRTTGAFLSATEAARRRRLTRVDTACPGAPSQGPEGGPQLPRQHSCSRVPLYPRGPSGTQGRAPTLRVASIKYQCLGTAGAGLSGNPVILYQEGTGVNQTK